MQATVDTIGLRHLTRALACLSKFGDDLVIVATPETFALSSTNQSLTAYGRFKYARSFFTKYRVGASGAGPDVEAVPTHACQIATKLLLQILKQKTVVKSCEKCELLISDGASQDVRPDGTDEDRDTLESRLTVRLHCKHGVVKTHRLALNAAENLMSPTMSEADSESRLTIGPKALRYMLDHFPFGKGSKSDPQLIWNFHETEVQLRSLECSVDAKGRAQLTTELTISAEEFEEYELQRTPMTIAFHLREFNATIAFAEASELSLEIRFTDPDAPLYIDVGGDLADTLFVIAASRLQSVSPESSQARESEGQAESKGKKRPLEEDSHGANVQAAERERGNTHARPGRPTKVVHRADADRSSIVREMDPPRPSAAEPQPSWAILTAAQPRQGQEPLFLPGSQLSQLPAGAEAAIIASGLGIEHMTAEELEDMLEGDGEEVEFSTQRSVCAVLGVSPGGRLGTNMDEDEEIEFDDDVGHGQRRDSFELMEDVEMAPTQNEGGTKV
ncbi:Rad9-domain-containing protein, partial [Trametes gibbosa]